MKLKSSIGKLNFRGVIITPETSVEVLKSLLKIYPDFSKYLEDVKKTNKKH